MLRYRTAQRKNNELPKMPYQLAQIDRNGKIGVILSGIINWATNIKNSFLRKIMEFIIKIDRRVKLPKYNSETFTNFFENNLKKISLGRSTDRKVVIYSTCFVNFNKKNTGVAALKVLKKNGVEVEHAYLDVVECHS